MAVVLKPGHGITETSASIGWQISPPRFDFQYPRPRLLQWLDDHGDAALLWIMGPPGSGKSHLAASDHLRHEQSHVWYRLSEEDNDSEHLKRSIAQALGAPPETLEAHIASLPRPFVLTLDDGHRLTEGTSSHLWIKQTVWQLPGNVKLRMIDRRAPPAAFTRLEASGHLLRLEAASLAFTPDEVQELGRCDESLWSRTRGWVLGVKLLHPAHTAGNGERGRQLLKDYFDTQVQGQLPGSRLPATGKAGAGLESCLFYELD